MTDNEIINIDEAIKHCYEVADRKCDDCGKEHLQLAKWLEELKASRETINHQKAEIERLKNSVSTFKSCYETLTDMYETSKSEAIEEFWNRLSENADTTQVDAFHSAYLIKDEDAENLIKEMTEQRGDSK